MPLVQFVQRVEVHAHPLASILFLFTTINAHHHHFLERPLFRNRLRGRVFHFVYFWFMVCCYKQQPAAISSSSRMQAAASYAWRARFSTCSSSSSSSVSVSHSVDKA